MLKKRGQITIFIIVGIFILIMLSIFLYLRQDRSQLVVTQTVPNEIVPIKNYIEECMEHYAEEGVLRMGIQGGYIYLPPFIDHNPHSYISLVENGPLKVPYWYYEGSSRAPTLEEMQDQISEYIDLNLRKCINNFEAFKFKFDIIEAGNLSTKTTITENNIVMTTTFPLDVKPKGTSRVTRIQIYDSVIPVKLKRIHRLAQEILDAENKNMFLEDLTIDLMTLGPDIPFTDMTLSCKRERWYKNEVADDIKNLLYYNLPRARFQDTKHQPFAASMSEYEKFRQVTPEDVAAGQYPKDAPPDLYDYYHLYWDVSPRDYSDLQANLYFERDWRFDMEVRPSDGNVMESSMGRGMEKYLKFLCLNIYHFTYDIIYPIQVVIQDDSAFGGKGFVFNYAIPVMINHNQGVRESFGVTVFETPKKDTEYCEGRREEKTYIYVKDKRTFDDLKGVNLTFSCMNSYKCYLGKTLREAGVYRYTSHLPDFCRPGSIEVEHPGYLKAVETVPSAEFMDIYLTPLKKMSFRVIKRRLTVDEFQDNELLKDDETVAIYITTKNATDYDVYAQYPYAEDAPLEAKTMDLILDESVIYNVDLILMKGDKLIGGYRGEWIPDIDDVINSREVIFVVMEKIPHPVTDGEQASLMIEVQNKDYLVALKPLFR